MVKLSSIRCKNYFCIKNIVPKLIRENTKIQNYMIPHCDGKIVLSVLFTKFIKRPKSVFSFLDSFAF
jgi:hypothetical protein